MASERVTEITADSFDTIETGDIEQFLGPLREHAQLTKDALLASVLFCKDELDKFFETLCEVEGRERGAAVYVSSVAMVEYYKRLDIPSILAVVVEAKDKRLRIANVGVIPYFPEDFNERRRAQLARRAQEVGEGFEDMLSGWRKTPEERIATFELPEFKPKPRASWN